MHQWHILRRHSRVPALVLPRLPMMIGTSMVAASLDKPRLWLAWQAWRCLLSAIGQAMKSTYNQRGSIQRKRGRARTWVDRLPLSADPRVGQGHVRPKRGIAAPQRRRWGSYRAGTRMWWKKVDKARSPKQQIQTLVAGCKTHCNSRNGCAGWREQLARPWLLLREKGTKEKADGDGGKKKRYSIDPSLPAPLWDNAGSLQIKSSSKGCKLHRQFSAPAGGGGAYPIVQQARCGCQICQ